MLPKRFRSILGPVRVKERANLRHEGEDLLGYADYVNRTIMIEATVPLETQTRVFWHEFMHFVLEETGVRNVFTDAQVEAICDAFSTMAFHANLGFNDGKN